MQLNKLLLRQERLRIGKLWKRRSSSRRKLMMCLTCLSDCADRFNDITTLLSPLSHVTAPTLIDPWDVLRIGQSKAYLKALGKLCKPINLLYRDDALQP